MDEPWMGTGAEFQALLQDLALKAESTTSASLSPASQQDGLFDNSDWLNWQADTSIIPDGDVNVANFLSFGLDAGVATHHSPTTAESDGAAYVPGSVTGATDPLALHDDDDEDSSVEDIPAEDIDNILAPDSFTEVSSGATPESHVAATNKRKFSDASSISDEQDNSKTATRRKPQKTYDENGKPQKVSHNIIEKRYRSNLNAQITELRDCVPILRAEVARNPNAKHNKGRIIGGASAYIQELEQRNRRLNAEKERAEARLLALERRLEHVRDRHNKKGRAAKLIVGGLAGMAAMSGWQQSEGEAHSTHALGALPLPMLNWLRSPAIADAMPAAALITKVLLIVAALYVILTWTDAAEPKTKTVSASRIAEEERDRAELIAAESKLGISPSKSSLRQLLSELVGLGLRTLGMATLPAEVRAAFITVADAQVTGRYPALSAMQLLTPTVALAGQHVTQELRALQIVLLLSGWLDDGLIRTAIGWFWSNGRAKKRGQDTPSDRLFSDEAMTIMRRFARSRSTCTDAELRAFSHAKTAIELLDAVAVDLALRSARQDAFDESKNLSLPLATIKRALPLLSPDSAAHFDALVFAALLGDSKKQVEPVLAAARGHSQLDAPRALQLLSVVTSAKLKSGELDEAKQAIKLVPFVAQLDQESCLALYMLAERCCIASLDKDDAVADRLHKFYGAIRKALLSPGMILDEAVRDKLALRCMQRMVRILKWDDDSGYESR